MPKIITSLFTGGSSPPAAPVFAPLPTAADPAVAAAEKAKLEEEVRRRKGGLQTTLTSGLGDTTTVAVDRPALKSTLG